MPTFHSLMNGTAPLVLWHQLNTWKASKVPPIVSTLDHVWHHLAWFKAVYGCFKISEPAKRRSRRRRTAGLGIVHPSLEYT